MLLWVLFALMTAMAMLAVLWPLVRGQHPSQSGNDLAVYRDQLEEIQRDRAAGQIGEAEAQAAKTEVSRRLIGAADAEAAEVPAKLSPASLTWHRRVVAAIAIVVLPLGAGSLYLAVGSPELPGQPLAARAEEVKNQSVDHLVAQVEQHLEANPDDARGWEVIAPVYLRLGRFDDAVKARRNLLRLGETAERQADLGEALVGAGNGIVTAEAKTAFERAVALDPMDVKGRYFLGLAAEQDGRRADAESIWREMVSSAPPGANWVGFVREELARIQGGPNPDEVAGAANLPPEQRMAMIRGMVQKLSDRLHQDGNDLEGWLRLVRSYMVLGERDKARAAAGDARRALVSDPAKVHQIDELVKGLGIEG